MTNTWLKGDNSINIQGRTIVDMARTGNNYEKWLRGHNTVNIQDRIMVLGFCPSPVSYLPDKVQ